MEAPFEGGQVPDGVVSPYMVAYIGGVMACERERERERRQDGDQPQHFGTSINKHILIANFFGLSISLRTWEFYAFIAVA